MTSLTTDVVKQLTDGGYAPSMGPSPLVTPTFRIIPIQPSFPPDQQLVLHRLNSFGSLYYFVKVALHRDKLTQRFHLPLCRQMERTHLKDLWEIPRDHLKALDVNTPILTTTGFKPMLNINIGDFVFSPNGSPTKVAGVSNVSVESRCYRITFSTGEQIIADAGHLWVTDVAEVRCNKRKYELPIRVSSTEQLARKVVYSVSQYGHRQYNHRIPVAAPVEFPEADLPIPPYVLGAWLGDGNSAAARLTNFDGVEELCESFGQKVSRSSRDGVFGLVGGMHTVLGTLGLLNNKHIPMAYASASSQQRLKLFQGLMDTDGTVNKEGQCFFVSAKQSFLNAVRSLAISLGYKPSPIGKYWSNYQGSRGTESSPWWNFSFYPPLERPPFLLERKASRLRPIRNINARSIIAIEPCDSVPVKCIATESGMYLAGDGLIPTHNSTICSEGLPMWWALPFGQSDADALRVLGYSDEFLLFMTQMHDPCTRTLLISETITNAAMLGSKIRKHFESNAVYRTLFPETLPTAAETWTNFSLHVKRPSGASPHGEGTFDLLGVGSALQSRHYVRHVKDDLVGRKAIESQSIMDKTIDYHQLSVGAYELEDAHHVNDELVVGNRWSYHDLNSYIRERETWFNIHSHSALGGCCAEHPIGIPIFPEQFSVEKLERIRQKLGSYNFSCQYLNDPCAPEDADFRPEWLRYYDFKAVDNSGTGQSSFEAKHRITHEVYDGAVRKDIDISHLAKIEITDPAHAGNAGANRCRHAVIVVGLSADNNFYLLDCWAKAGSYDSYFDEIYAQADRWKINKLGVETVAAQKYIAYHINYRNMQTGRRHLKIVELRGEVESPDGTVTRKKEFRIRNVLLPIFENGRFWCQRRHADFIGEFTSFPKGRFCDILDALAYAPQVLRSRSTHEDWSKWVAENAQRAREMGQPYSVGVN